MKQIKNYIKTKTKIFSLEHGAGEIVRVFKLYDGIQDYLEVKFFDKSEEKIFFPVRFKSDLRIISNPIELTSILKSLSLMIAENNSPQNLRLNQRFGVEVDLDYLTGIIALLVGDVGHRLEDRKLLLSCIESLILEVSCVFKINEKTAKGIVSDCLRAA